MRTLNLTRRHAHKPGALERAQVALERRGHQSNSRGVKRYNLHGIAGLVARSRNRSTGNVMSMYNAEQAEMDSEEPWIAVCEEHGTMVSAATQALARESMTYPVWCEQCSGEAES